MPAQTVALLLLDLALIPALAFVLGFAVRAFGQPAVIGEIVAGVLLGPTLLHGAIANALFPPAIRAVLGAVAQLGVTGFMFLVGLELDLARVRREGSLAGRLSLGATLAPLGLGCALAVALAGRHGTANRLGFVLFLGVAMAVTAFPVLARILTDRGLSRTPLGNVALASAALGDVLAWSLLAIIATIIGGGQAHWRILFVVPYVVLMLFVVRPLMRRIQAASDRRGRVSPGAVVAMVGGLLASAAATEWMGMQLIFGAFFFGALMPRDTVGRVRQELGTRMEHLSSMLLPVYFVVSGLQVDLSGLHAADLLELGLILLVAVGGKLCGAYLGARSHRVPSRPAMALATLMNTRGLTELIILTTGLELGVLDQRLYSLMVVMAVVTTAMTGPLVQLIIRDRPPVVELRSSPRKAERVPHPGAAS